MFSERRQRLKCLTDLLGQNSEIGVTELAERLQVSDMTVRRDLDELERQKIVRRIHGGAILLDPSDRGRDPYIQGQESAKNAEQKRKIGKEAAAIVQPNETIFLDSGSTTPFVASHIDENIPLTVVCYTLMNALEFYQRANTNLILLGGYFHRDSNIFHNTGNPALISEMRADKAFISTAGVDEQFGLTTYFYYEAEIKKQMMKSARKVILVCDSTKFAKISVTCFADLEEIDTVVTDDGIPNGYREALEGRGIELLIAK